MSNTIRHKSHVRNFSLLKLARQRRALRRVIEGSHLSPLLPKDRDLLEGLENLLDDLYDNSKREE